MFNEQGETTFEVAVRRTSPPGDRLRQRKIKREGREVGGPTSTRVEMVEVTRELVAGWERPHWQRPITVTAKVRRLAEQIAESGVIPGVLTIGEWNGVQWRVDCQHRLQAFEMSGAAAAYADVRFAQFAEERHMADEYDSLNGHLVNMRPDDKLRALELSYDNLRVLREQSQFVGYDKIRRGSATAPILSMSRCLRLWYGAGAGAPVPAHGNPRELAERLTGPEVDFLLEFLGLAYAAWGRDVAYDQLWCQLNLGLCMWIFRGSVANIALRLHPDKMPRTVFVEALKSLREPGFLDWLRGRHLGDRDRAPAYGRIKKLMLAAARKNGHRATLPSPDWCGGS